MSDNHAPELDGDVLGEQVGDDGLPGLEGFPPDQMQGVNDPNQVAPDDVAMREARTRGEAVPGDPERAGDLLPPVGDDDRHDDVEQLLGSRGDEDGAAMPAEVAAMRLDEST
jgi:hypothetical protein